MNVSLVSGWLPVVVPTVAAVAILAGVDWRHGPAVRAFGSAVVAAAVLTVAAWWAQMRWEIVPGGFPAVTYVWVGVVLLAVCGATATAAHLRTGPTRPRRHRSRSATRWVRFAVALLAVPLAASSALIAVNRQYRYYPTLASLRGDAALPSHSLDAIARLRAGALTHRQAPPADPAHPGTTVTPQPVGEHGTTPTPPRSPTDPTPPPAAPAQGLITQVPIPGTVSGFAGRPAWVWVPPRYLDGSVDRVPVIMLLAGSPSQTSDWLRGGGAAATAQRYADQHGGVAPMLVMPDANGSTTADTECVDRRGSRAETYLTQDVPAYLAARLGAAGGRQWAVAGLSAGGMCAAMLALRHPDRFVAFGDFSGLTSPTLTDRIDRSATAKALFDGDTDAYDRHDPLWLLAHQPPRSVLGYWQVGADDRTARDAQRRLVALARTAGLPTTAVETPGGGHDFTFWTRAFNDALPSLAAAVGTVDGRH